MAKQRNAPPHMRLETLVEEVLMNSRLAGSPVRKLDMAKALAVTDRHFSSLIKKDREGKAISPAIVPTLMRMYKQYLPTDVEVKADVRTILEHLLIETIRGRAERAFLMAREKARMTPAQWKAAERAIELDEARQLAEVRAKGYIS